MFGRSRAEADGQQPDMREARPSGAPDGDSRRLMPPLGLGPPRAGEVRDGCRIVVVMTGSTQGPRVTLRAQNGHGEQSIALPLPWTHGTHVDELGGTRAGVLANPFCRLWLWLKSPVVFEGRSVSEALPNHIGRAVICIVVASRRGRVEEKGLYRPSASPPSVFHEPSRFVSADSSLKHRGDPLPLDASVAPTSSESSEGHSLPTRLPRRVCKLRKWEYAQLQPQQRRVDEQAGPTVERVSATQHPAWRE